MSEYPEKQIPEREFFFKVLWTLYPIEVGILIEATYKARNQRYQEDNNDMIEMIGVAKKVIDYILTYKSKQRFSYRLLQIKEEVSHFSKSRHWRKDIWRKDLFFQLI